MKVEEKMIAENACQARNLFQTEFIPQPLSTEDTTTLIKNKIHG